MPRYRPPMTFSDWSLCCLPGTAVSKCFFVCLVRHHAGDGDTFRQESTKVNLRARCSIGSTPQPHRSRPLRSPEPRPHRSYGFGKGVGLPEPSVQFRVAVEIAVEAALIGGIGHGAQISEAEPPVQKRAVWWSRRPAGRTCGVGLCPPCQVPRHPRHPRHRRRERRG